MAQLLARIPDDLHRRLKQRAAAEQRSLNDLVTEALETAVDAVSPKELYYRQLRARGKLSKVVFPTPAHVPTDEEFLAALGPDGGRAVIEELDAERERGRR